MPWGKKAEPVNELLDPTSSLNKYYMCVCSKRYKQKFGLIKHIPKCELIHPKKKSVCRWCKLEFKTRGNLVVHAYHMHGVKKPPKPDFKCDVCDARFNVKWKVKFHVRENHFNLYARVPHANAKRVNQVWFEKVLNTNLVMEIKKTGANRLVMKPTSPDAGVKVHTINKRVDLRHQYPIKPLQQDTQCKQCKRFFRKNDLSKHIYEVHSDVPKHQCNNCNMTFKRSYKYLHHVCHKHFNRKPIVKGVKHDKSSSIRIARVESLTLPMMD